MAARGSGPARRARRCRIGWNGRLRPPVGLEGIDENVFFERVTRMFGGHDTPDPELVRPILDCCDDGRGSCRGSAAPAPVGRVVAAEHARHSLEEDVLVDPLRPQEAEGRPFQPSDSGGRAKQVPIRAQPPAPARLRSDLDGQVGAARRSRCPSETDVVGWPMPAERPVGRQTVGQLRRRGCWLVRTGLRVLPRRIRRRHPAGRRRRSQQRSQPRRVAGRLDRGLRLVERRVATRRRR